MNHLYGDEHEQRTIEHGESERKIENVKNLFGWTRENCECEGNFESLRALRDAFIYSHIYRTYTSSSLYVTYFYYVQIFYVCCYVTGHNSCAKKK